MERKYIATVVMVGLTAAACTTSERAAYSVGAQYNQLSAEAIVRQFGPAMYLRLHPTENRILVEDQPTAHALPKLVGGIALGAAGATAGSPVVTGTGQYKVLSVGAGSGQTAGLVATEAVKFFLGNTGCEVNGPAQYYKPWWEVSFRCPPDFDYRAAVKAQREALRRSVPLQR